MKYALPLLGLSLLSSGCALVEDMHRNAWLSLCTPMDTHKEVARNRRWAESAWCDFATKDSIGHRSTDYADGFKDGYAEYLYRGGDGEPPLVAPLRYRHARFQTPQGYQMIEEWFAGYRHGASVARDTGVRRFITGPSALHVGENDLRPPFPRSEPWPSPMPEPVKETPTERVPMLDMPRTLEFPPPVDAPTKPEPALPEQIRIRIRNLNDAPRVAPEAPPVVAPTKIKITQIREAEDPPVEPARARITGIIQTPEPPRARITTINTAPPKD